MAESLANKIVLVTGAGSPIGLGRAMTLALVRAGARVAMMDVDGVALERSADDARALGGPNCVYPILGDVTDPSDAVRVVQQVIADLGGLHVLINNAGINPRIDPSPSGVIVSQVPPVDWARTFAVNVNGPFHMTRAVIEHFIAQKWGRIIGVTTSLDTMLRGLPYGPTKAAHEAFVASVSRELEGTGVTANVLVPGGAVNTNMTLGTRDPSLMLDPEVMQDPVVWLASDASDGFNGRRIIAQFWDEELPLAERLEKASAPAAWPQLGRQAT